VIIKRKIESDIKDKIINFQKENKIGNGIRLIEDYKRYYPYGSFASSVIGFTGSDSQGLAGLENYYNKELTGEPGRIVTAKNAIGTDLPFKHEQMIPAKNGCSLVLSIDESVQHSLEKYLEEGRIKNKAVNGAVAILMDVNSGEILGLAVKNDYDLNSPFEIHDPDLKAQLDAMPQGDERKKFLTELLEKQWRNKAVNDMYMPGSVFKIITSSMSLQENIVNENTKFNCTGGVSPFPGARIVHCHKKSGHGQESFIQGFCNSCNPVFISLGQQLGVERFYKYFKSFGFTQRTGIDLPGEASGIFFSKDGTMAPMDLVVASFGQNFKITPIQMITAVSAAVNGGNLVKPHIVKKIIDNQGNIVKSMEENIKRQVISSEVSRKICEMMQINALKAPKSTGYVPGYRIGGKTGTSEKIGEFDTNGKKNYIASFCGITPSESPKYALLVFYDTPRGDNYYGGLVAAPVGAKIFEEALPKLGVEKIYSEKELETMEIPVPDLVGMPVYKAREQLEKLGIIADIKGTGKTVISQVPSSSEAKISKGGKMILKTEEDINNNKKIAVPDFLNMSVAEVNRIAALLNLTVKITGTTQGAEGLTIVSVNQDIKAGEQVDSGTVITVEFAAQEFSEN